MKKKILIATSVEEEKEAVLRGWNNSELADCIVVGVGSPKAAARTAMALMKGDYGLVINMGIAGGFRDKTYIGSIVIATEIISADLGSETEAGFMSLEQLKLGNSRFHVDKELVEQIYEKLKANDVVVSKGPVLTVSTTTGTIGTLKKLKTRFPDAVAEAMEGYGVAVSAHEQHLPCLEIRAISNYVGPRVRKAWKIKEALEMLQLASSCLQEVFLK